MKTFWQELKVDGEPMRVYASHPDEPGPFPAVVVIQHQGGVDEFIQEMSQRVAVAGYFAAAPDLYHRDSPDCKDDAPTRRGRLRDVTVINDVNAAADFVNGHRLVDRDRIGIIGFCMGGRVAYMMPAINPAFRAAVDYYGGHIFKAWGDGPTAFERTAAIGCPLLGHFGEDDQNPSPADMRRLDAELARFGKVHEFYSYPNAGHGFMRKSSEGYREHADRRSWPRTLDFLRRYLIEIRPEKAAIAR